MPGNRAPATPPMIDGLTDPRFLASGGYADVFVYRQQQPAREVAVKVLLHDGSTEAGARQFSNEGHALARVSGHPHILTVFWAARADDGRSYLVMEYCPPPTLGARALADPPAVAAVLRHGIQLAGALETVHQAGIIHRDIKPGNVLLGRNGAPKLSDFGIAALSTVDGMDPAPDEPSGVSIPWSAREILFAGPHGRRADVHSLAATVYTLLAGRSPYYQPGGDNGDAALIARIAAGPPPPSGRAGVPPTLENLLRQAMSPDPQARPATAEAFGRALQSIEQQERYQSTALEVTPLSVATPAALPDPVVDDDETRLKGPTVVRLDGPPRGSRTRVMPAPAGTIHQEDTKKGVPGPPAPDPDAAPTPRPRSARAAGLLVGAGLAVLLAVAGIGVAVAGRDHPATTTQTGAPPGDALPNDATPVPVPTVTATRAATTVTFTWTYDNPAAGDYFLVRRADGPSPAAQKVLTPKLILTTGPADHPCVEVTVFRADGRGSATAGRACAP